jgi:plasmid stabilization system protein ParE
VVLLPEAEDELDEATQWYERQAGLGDDLLAEVQTVLTRIGQLPELHQVVYRDVRRAVVRRFPYSVFYRVHSDRIEVISVFHSKRNPTVWKRRV